MIYKNNNSEAQDSLLRKVLFQGLTDEELTKEHKKQAIDTIKSDLATIFGMKEIKPLKKMINGMLEWLDGEDASDEIIFATCRRLSKSTKMIIIMLVSLIRLPWYNAALTVKFANRIQKSILPSVKASIQIMRKTGWITFDESQYLISCITQAGINFNGRNIVFASAQTPDAALSIQATTDAPGFTGIFIHQVDDELIIEEFKGTQKVNITDEDQMRALSSISESLDRNLIPPFGKSFQKIRLFNTWDFTHKYYREMVEDVIPTSDRYKNIKKREIAEWNRDFLINEEVNNDGIIIKEFTKSTKKLKTFLISYKAMPEHRFKVDDYVYMKAHDYNRWLPIYGAVPGKSINDLFTYPIDLKKLKYVKNVDWTTITNIFIGLDRGKRDKTAVSIVLKNKEGKWIFYSGCEIHKHQNELQSSKKIIVNYLNEVFAEMEHIITGTLRIQCDFHAYDFISAINDWADQQQDSFFVKNRETVRKYILEPVKLRSFWSRIGNRVDLFNDKFAYNDIMYIDSKQTNIEQEITGEQMIERFENCKDDIASETRNEKNGANDLDMINAIEYAVVNDIN